MAYMDTDHFEQVVIQQLEKCEQVLASKAEEYAAGGDRLHNFNMSARINDKPVEEMIWYKASKHLTCIIDMVQGRLTPTMPLLDEKIGDMINYLIILKAHFINELKPLPTQQNSAYNYAEEL